MGLVLKQSRKYVKNQKWFSFTIAYMLSFLGILNCVNAILNEINLHTSIDTIICYGLLIACVVVCMIKCIFECSFKIDILYIFFFFLISYFVTLIFYPINSKLLFTEIIDYEANPIYIIFIYSLPCYYFIRQITDFKILTNYMRKFSYLIVGLSIIVFFLLDDSFANQYMTLSYNALLQLVFLLFFKPEKYKLFHYLILSLGIFVIAVGGARGALLGLLVAVFFKIFGKENKMKYKTVVMILFIILIGFIMIYLKEIIKFLIDLLDLFDISSRTLELFISNDTDFTSGRADIYSECFNKMNLIGYGLYGDRIITTAIGHAYAHNLFIELLVNHGMIIGTIVIGLILYLIIHSFVKAKGDMWIYIIVFIPSGFVALMLSSSYLNQIPALYVLLGMCVSVLMNYKTYKI